MASWKKTISTPFKKAVTFFNQQHQPTEKKYPHHTGNEGSVMDLRGEVMACGYEDVQVMWSILDRTKPSSPFNPTS